MVSTGARANALSHLLIAAGLRSATEPRAPRLQSLSPQLAEEIVRLYQAFGGHGEQPQLRPGSWDLAFDGGLVIELDEELHFNRYRRLSLQSDWAGRLPWREAYLRFCETHEERCLAAAKWGKRWANPSCEAMFAAADPPGVFGPGGAPRWKQRALCDGVKDAFALTQDEVRLARISTHDQIDGVEVGEALEGRAVLSGDALVAFVQQRSI